MSRRYDSFASNEKRVVTRTQHQLKRERVGWSAALRTATQEDTTKTWDEKLKPVV